MINKIISFSIRNKMIVFLMTLGIIVVGIWSMATINLGSVPDITDNQVQVITTSQNLGTEDVEQFLTYPIELAMGNLPGVKEVRSISRSGLSVVTIVFEDKMGTYKPRQLVQEALLEAKEKMPKGIDGPSVGPISTGLGEIYQYTIEVQPGYEKQYDLTKLRTIQDWIVKRQMTMLKGVVEVNSFGGNVKQYEVSLSPDRLRTYGLTVNDVFKALSQNNANTGGGYIEKDRMAYFIRSEGLVRSIEDIKSIVLTHNNGIPVTIDEVADHVGYGNRIRYGAFTKDGKETVGGIIMMLKDANQGEVIKAVKKRMAEIQQTLPKGLTINPFLERDELISRTTNTVKSNLIEGALIVIFALVLLLGSVRGGLITATTIPLSLLFAFILMKQFNISANLMSLGAIDFGIIVDGAVIIVEATVFALSKRIKETQSRLTVSQMDDITYQASSKMMGSAFFGQVIILLVFAPILFLSGVAGKTFRPMASTFAFAMLGAILLCLTYVPAMVATFMKPGKENSLIYKIESKIEGLSKKIIKAITRWYGTMLDRALKHKKIVLLSIIAIFIPCCFLFANMGGEFIPKLDEGDLAMQAMIRSGGSLSESIETSEKIEILLKQNFPEVKSVSARIGVADIPTDPMPMDIADIFISLEKDHKKWTSAKSRDELIEKMSHLIKSNLVGVNVLFSQPVELRFNELLTGIREDIAIKLYGDDLNLLKDKATEIANLIGDIEGVKEINPERISGLPQITVTYDRLRMSRYGISIDEMNDYISTAFSGGVAGEVSEGEKRFDLVVRLSPGHRKGIESVKELLISLPDGSQVPLSELAEIRFAPAPMQISRDNTFRRISIGINIRGRDVASVVEDIRNILNEKLLLPPGYSISYGGSFQNLQEAKSRLAIVIPAALFLIFILLYFALHSFKLATMIYIAIPLSAIGGVLALTFRGMPFSISAGVGFIVLFGISVLNGLVLINCFNNMKNEPLDIRVKKGAKERLRPILLTAVTDIAGFIPMAVSTSAGAEVQRPLATVVIGGMISATILTLIILPILYELSENNSSKSK